MPRTKTRKQVQLPTAMDLMAFEFFKGMTKTLKKCQRSGLDTIEAELCLREAFKQTVFYLENCEERKQEMG